MVTLIMGFIGFAISQTLVSTGHDIRTWQWWVALGLVCASYTVGTLKGYIR